MLCKLFMICMFTVLSCYNVQGYFLPSYDDEYDNGRLIRVAPSPQYRGQYMVPKEYLSNPQMGPIVQPKYTKHMQPMDNMHKLQQRLLEQRNYYDGSQENQPFEFDNLRFELLKNEGRLKNGRFLENKLKRKASDESLTKEYVKRSGEPDWNHKSYIRYSRSPSYNMIKGTQLHRADWKRAGFLAALDNNCNGGLSSCY